MSEKARVELRFDAELHQQIRELAEESGVSMNQLVQGVMAWAVDHGHPGLPVVDSLNGPEFVESSDEDGVWFGETGYDEDGNPSGKGNVVFALDFTSRRSVRLGREVRQ